ncbi:hypothetical protein FR637_01890 [Campylobacter jejuni]|nr:hypothetical protein [Campylobacter jejuni]ECL1954757.1 hypothetical protein [Campylobacter jejuni]ECL1957089.1 hypothetical protein [Campylobacter jejuni]
MAEEKLLKSLADGVLKINESSIDVAVLENGVRIITHSGVFRALGREPRGNARYHQSLSKDIGQPNLTAQIYKVIGIMQTSDNMKQMWENFKKIKLREQDEDIEFDEKGRLKEK